MARVVEMDYERIIRSRHLVKLSRKRLDPDDLYGFVVASGEALTLLHVLETHTFTLNGYSAVRNDDVSRCVVYDRPDDYFDSRALKLKGIGPRPLPGVSVASLPDLLASAARHFPLITIHRERISTEFCSIGRLEGMTQRTFTLFEIDAGAEWEGPHRYRFEDVTKVDFGGGYEEALALAARENDRKRPRRKRAAKTA